MSFEAISALFDNLDNNEELSKEFETIKSDEDFKTNLVALGAKFGYEFTLEELEQVAATAKKIQEGENLS